MINVLAVECFGSTKWVSYGTILSLRGANEATFTCKCGAEPNEPKSADSIQTVPGSTMN